MTSGPLVLRGTVSLVLVLLALALLAASISGVVPTGSISAEGAKTGDESNKQGATRPYQTDTVRGKVVWLDEALKRLYNVTTEADAAETIVALETPDGQLLPLVPDTRGRAFAVDERLRNIDLEMLVRRYRGMPLVQVIRLYRVQPEGLYEIDYWCDTCAISMFILKACECCQGPTRLRAIPVQE